MRDKKLIGLNSYRKASEHSSARWFVSASREDDRRRLAKDVMLVYRNRRHGMADGTRATGRIRYSYIGLEQWEFSRGGTVVAQRTQSRIRPTVDKPVSRIPVCDTSTQARLENLTWKHAGMPSGKDWR